MLQQEFGLAASIFAVSAAWADPVYPRGSAAAEFHSPPSRGMLSQTWQGRRLAQRNEDDG